MRVPRKLAVKVLTPGLARDQAWVKRFEREMQATAILAHPHIVEIIDYGHDPDIGYYLVMEHLDGEDLRSRINREGPVSVLDMLAVMRQVTDALGAAHDAGIVHRDVKSANVFLLHTRTRGPNLSVKLLDFGVAVVTRPHGRMRRLQPDEAESKQVIGSPATMSPEQIRGEELDARSDIYSLGVVLFRMLTGTVPFSAGSVEELWQLHLNQPAPPPSSFAAAAWAPQELDHLVRQMLAKRPAQRPDNVREVMGALERVADTVESAWAKHYVLSPPRQDSRRLRRLREIARETTAPADTRAVKPSSVAAVPAPAAAPPPLPPPPRPMVLAVDDEPAMRTFVKRLIHRKGYGCEAVESGAAAMTWLVENPEPDAIVLDFLMPGLAGVDLIRTLRTRGCNAPIIVWSGLDSVSIKEQIKEQSVAAVLDKYDDVHRIGDVLAELLGEEE